jgi:hypothetical protein
MSNWYLRQERSNSRNGLWNGSEGNKEELSRRRLPFLPIAISDLAVPAGLLVEDANFHKRSHAVLRGSVYSLLS